MMLGGLLMIFLLVVGFPLAFMATGAVLSAILGQSLWHDGEDRHPGSDLVDLNR
jgi:hypothetical protein